MKKTLFALMAATLVCASCAKEIQEAVPEQQNLMAKLVGDSQGEIVPGQLLIRIDETSAGNINRGDYSIFNGIEGISVTPAIPVQPKNQEAARRYGLHQWYSVQFEEQTKPEMMAERLASLKQVRAVQFSRCVEPVASGEAVPFEMPVMAKSENVVGPEPVVPFNDPLNIYQWNLINDGSVASDAVAGADVGVKDAWKLTAGDPSVVVAVFDCAINVRHEDLKDAVWVNQPEKDGQSGVDDDGNGFIDDIYGFNFVNCMAYNDEDLINGALEGKKPSTAIKGQPLNYKDGIGHGMHVAGIIGATNNNGTGVSSIAGGTNNNDGVRLMTCQIFQGNAYCTDAQSAAAFIYAADNGACIAQCSYGNHNIITDDDTYLNGGELEDGTVIKSSTLENAALRYFLDPSNSNHESLKGNIAVFAAGNHQNPYSIYPGALPYVLSVTAFGYDFMPGGYSNYGPGCKIAAPGGEWKGVSGENFGMILSTGYKNPSGGYPGVVVDRIESSNYIFMQGTSMACPHVSGVLALGISYAKKLGKTFTRDEMTSMLLSTTNDIDQYNKGGSQKFFPPFSSTPETIDLSAYKGNMGAGAVDAWKFLMAIEGTPSVMAKVGEKCSIDLSEWLGTSAKNMSYKMDIDQATKESLGITTDPVLNNGIIELTCTKIGAGKVTLSSSIGKDKETEGGIGEMNFSREISIVSRPYAASNGGWF